MMKVFFILMFVMAGGFILQAQCVSGDCKNGNGKFDFGWCVYEGEFKNEKPEGNGSMKYDDYTYTGSFKNGVEDGKGILAYKDGRKEEVMYSNGEKINYKPVVLKPGEYTTLKGHDPNCVSGNCETGFGTYLFASGNKYVGNFVNERREGNGKFYFANGEMFEGLFHDNERKQGTYTFKNGAKYTGTYDVNGNELDGAVTISTGMSVAFVNGKAIVPKEPVSTATTTGRTNPGSAAAQKDVRVCKVCSGRGSSSTHETFYDGGRIDKNGSTHFGQTTVKSCYACGGKGYTVR